ncbi:MAG: FtsX-like permease family protein [Actinomycetota bacterium]
MDRLWFWLRWSARELRRRWVQVTVIALIIALGTGTQAGLGSTSDWRRLTYDANHAMLHTHDLRVSLSEGSFVPKGTLTEALSRMRHRKWVVGAEERLIVPTQVDASTEGRTILVPGRIVGVDVAGHGPAVDEIWLTGGRALTAADDGTPVATLEGHFADYYDLPPSGRVELAGGLTVDYAGTGYSPEYFVVVNDELGYSIMAEANFAVLFAPLGSVGALSGHDGQANDLVLTLKPGVDRDVARAEVDAALAAAVPEMGATVSTIEDDLVYRFMYGDLESDQDTFNQLAILILLAAALAAFNLTSRIVEAQRREIGIEMAIGARRGTIALRPLLVGAEIAFLGVIFGVPIGWLVGAAMKAQFEHLQALPVWQTPFQPDRFVGAAVLGFLLPFLATAWPVWRAVRVEPADAIRSGHLASRGGGLAPLLKRVPVPGGSFGQMPVRNVLRAPRRTVVTAGGIGAAIMVLVAILGMLDSLWATVDAGDRELLNGAPNRVVVDLAGFVPADEGLVPTIESSPTVGVAEPVLRLGGSLRRGGVEFDVSLEVLDPQSSVWRPRTPSTVPPGDLPGIVIAQKAARDLGVSVGDTIDVSHPVREGPSAFAIATTRMRVVGIHPSPVRSFAYLDASEAGLMGLVGVANAVQVIPASGASVADVKRAVFGLPGVASVQPVSAMGEQIHDVFEQMGGIITVMEFFAVALAFLVAFNAANINVDERAREHATMFAFGLRLRTLLRMTGIESLIVGLLGALVGLGAGAAVLGPLLSSAGKDSPQIEILTRLAPATAVAALAFGALAALLAPLLTARKLRRMDVASTLRVME